jgi:hypothetical protein
MAPNAIGKNMDRFHTVLVTHILAELPTLFPTWLAPPPSILLRKCQSRPEDRSLLKYITG